jgi:beta-lactamase superfamily II metal-dependent hydrolase
MTRRRVTLVAFATGLFCNVTVFADIVVPKEQNGVDVSIHATDSSASAEIGQLPFGESRDWISSRSNWYEIRMTDGQPGFVSKRATRLIRTPPARAIDELRIHYLNVGSGACTLIECPGPDAPPMVVDCGSVGAFSFDLDGSRAATYIRSVLAGHATAPNVVISHPHTDHYDMIPEILDGIQAQNIWLGGDDSGYSQSGFPAWRQAQEAGHATMHINHAKDFHNDEQPMNPQALGCGLAEVYTLTVNTGDGPNPNSHVMEIRYGSFGATFTGDAEGITEAQADANFDGDIKTTVLSASHHGSSTHGSNGSHWVDATDPEIVVFSSGPLFGHPRCDVVARYDAKLSPAPPHPVHCGDNTGFRHEGDSRLAKYVTATNGLIVITSDGSAPAELFCDGQADCTAGIQH